MSRTARIYDRQGFLVRSGVEVEQVFVNGDKYLRVGSTLLWWGDVEILPAGAGFVCLCSGMTIKL